MKSKLFGAGLTPIDSEELVYRYNECLGEMGIAPTAQTSFHIDGVGWSAEIAREKNDFFYLSAGIANQMGIIITPNQRNKPIYFPFNSYDRALMQGYFSRFKSEIADITATRGICLDIDQELTTYESPQDLRMVNYIIVRSSTGTLGKVTQRQRQLVQELINTDNGWMNAELRKAISQSAGINGDLRYRKLTIADFRFDDLQSFYTRAFGGVFVIRTLDHASRLLLFEDKKYMDENAWKKDMYYLYDPVTLDILIRDGLLEVNLAWYQSYPQVLAYLKECLMAEIICTNEPQINYAELNPMQKKNKLVRLADKVWEIYHELERLIVQLQSTTTPSAINISKELQLLLLRPLRTLPLVEQQVLRQVLHRLLPLDIIQMYADDKNLFYEKYQQWPHSKKAWAEVRIYQDYIVEGPVQ